MVSRGDAERALNAINGTPIRHGTAERAAVKSAKGKKGRDAAKLALAQAMEGAQPERQVAVDWALSKKDWEQRAEETDADTDAETGKEDESDDDSSADAGSDLDPEAVDELMHDGAEDETDDEENEDDEEMEAPVKPALPAPEEGTTLFIRNLPYQATEPELRDLFRSFGPLRYAKITMDKATQRSRGTGFVCFWQVESADAALRQARLVESEAGPGARGKPAAPAAAGAKNPFTLPSILTADASAPLTASLTLHGRVLSVTPAVAREQAGSLEAAARAAREKGDKRNTHLMREGVPFPNSPLARDMSESEKEKRLASFGVRKSQLGANPSLFISKTRLSVRQLPLFATDRILKRLAIYAVRHFGLEARAGERTDLSAEEKGDRTMSAALTGEDGLPKQKRTERQTAVVQSKVVRQQDRLDPLTGNGRSRGYGFLEMRSFIDALKVIRWANARPDVGKLMQEWWLEELEALVKRLKVAREKQEGNERVETDARLKRLAKRIEELQSGKQVEKAERGGLLQSEWWSRLAHCAATNTLPQSSSPSRTAS
jgi:nucleolar protein 4